jgi:hypothetical protein
MESHWKAPKKMMMDRWKDMKLDEVIDSSVNNDKWIPELSEQGEDKQESLATSSTVIVTEIEKNESENSANIIKSIDISSQTSNPLIVKNVN